MTTIVSFPVYIVTLHCSPCRHFDLNKLWISDKEFTAGVYVIVVEAMQVHIYTCTGGQVLSPYRIAGKFRGVKIRLTRETVVFVSKNFV